MRSHPLPLILLTGFLGSGKTSTLGHWLTHTDVPLKRTAVIINDFGAVNVDAALLSRRQLELRSITGGCVCCQSFEDLVAQVRILSENPDFDLVWIETSGLADPEEVLDHLSVPELQESTVIRRMILVVDGSDFPCSWRGRAVQEEQIRYADLILLNKTDRIDDTARQRVEIALRQINPEAQIIVTEHGKVEPGLLSGGNAETSAHSHTHHHTRMKITTTTNPATTSMDTAIMIIPTTRTSARRLDSFPALDRTSRTHSFPTLSRSPAHLGLPRQGLHPADGESRAATYVSAGPRPGRIASAPLGNRNRDHHWLGLHWAATG